MGRTLVHFEILLWEEGACEVVEVAVLVDDESRKFRPLCT